MKKSKILVLLFLIVVLKQGLAQNLDAESFDFWVGDWDLTWINNQGLEMKGSNQVKKILNSNVIQENFEDLQSGYKGMSLSVFKPRSGKWHQAWADSGGGYFNFVGGVEEGIKIFATEMQEVGDRKIIKRMKFLNVQQDSFTWEWETSVDGGQNWSLKWRIFYKRQKVKD